MPETNLTIAQKATMRPITEIAANAGIDETLFEPVGKYKAKLTTEATLDLPALPRTGKLILATAMTPTPHGEGKTTTSVGLVQGLQHIGKRAIPALREPSLGPIFGTKGGACGGGYSQVLPMEDINLFFNGDFPAVAAAHNLLSAMLDAHVYHGNAAGLDIRRVFWPRTMDMNDRALRDITIGLGGTANGYPREDGFVITSASEVMAILCMSDSLADLTRRLGDILIGTTTKGEPIRARDIGADGPMSVLLKDAIRPNLVQTMEGGPALIHGGPFANIAHGCSSILGTRCALRMSDFVVTEGGFAGDLGAEKFLDIKCRRLGHGPDGIMLVVTARAVKHHGNGDLKSGLVNVAAHLRHLTQYGPPVIVAVNKRADDAQADLDDIVAYAKDSGAAEAVIADPWGSGGPGCADLAQAVVRATEKPSTFQHLYADDDSFEEKLTKIVTKAYGGNGFHLEDKAAKKLEWMKKHGLDKLPICVAKTQYSLSDDASKLGAPRDFFITVREIKPSLGAGFVVVQCGEMLLMPGLGKAPAALEIRLDEQGKITGMF